MRGGQRKTGRDFGRRYVQLITAVLYNCHITGFATGRIYRGSFKGICAPGLNCYSCPGAVFACPLGALQGALAGSARRIPYYVLGTFLLFGVLLGRVICGFLCPFGLIQELLHAVPLPKIRKSRVTRGLSCVKYGILIVLVIAYPLIRIAPGFCRIFCPAGTLEAGIPLVLKDAHLREQIGGLFSLKVAVLAACILLCMICYRAFCRFFCPLGAIYSLFHPIAFWGIRVEEEKCTGCQACVHACRMDVRRVGDRECIHCGDCRNVCPERAIRYGGGSRK